MNMFLTMGAIGSLMYLALCALLIVAGWKVFQKAGKPGWAFIVPIYNMIVMLEIIKKPIWWLIMLFIPIVNIVFLVMIYNQLAKCFGKEVGFTIGLLLLPFIFLPILGFGDAVYHEPADPAFPSSPNTPPTMPA